MDGGSHEFGRQDLDEYAGFCLEGEDGETGGWICCVM
jgi:hypothetical protein